MILGVCLTILKSVLEKTLLLRFKSNLPLHYAKNIHDQNFSLNSNTENLLKGLEVSQYILFNSCIQDFLKPFCYFEV